MIPKRLFLVVLALLVAVGCASQAALSPRGKAAMMLATYNSQAQATKTMSERTNLTEAQKDVVRKKKAIFVKLDPIIKGYALVAQKGGTPSLEDEAAIYQMIDDLVALSAP